MAKKILLADDSITIQKVVELTFSDGDYEVIATNNGAKAIQRLSEVRPDIVLSDIIMPEKNGYEVCEYIKSHPEFRNTPVILLTGTFEPFDPDRAEKAGCDAVVTKPFESQSLVQKVAELIAQSEARATASQSPLDPPSAPPVADEQAAEETHAWPVRPFAFGAETTNEYERAESIAEDAPFSQPPSLEPETPAASPFDEAPTPEWEQPFEDEIVTYSEPFATPPAAEELPDATPALAETTSFGPVVPSSFTPDEEKQSSDQPEAYGSDLFAAPAEEPAVQDLPFEEATEADFSLDTRAFPKLSMDDLNAQVVDESPAAAAEEPVVAPSFELDELSGPTEYPLEEAPADFAGVQPELEAELDEVASYTAAEPPTSGFIREPEVAEEVAEPLAELPSQFGLGDEGEPVASPAFALDQPEDAEDLAEEEVLSADEVLSTDEVLSPEELEPAAAVQDPATDEGPWSAEPEPEEIPEEVREVEAEEPVLSMRTEPAWAPSDTTSEEPLSLSSESVDVIDTEDREEQPAAEIAATDAMLAPDGSELFAGNLDAISWSPTSPPSITPAMPIVGRAEAAPSVAAAPVDLSALTDEQVDRIARRVVELLSDKTVRGIAWEVIPDIAEMVVKERIRQLENEG